MSFNQSGSKYLREMKGLSDGKADVYAVIVTFDVKCPARQHAIKKILCSGIRGKGSELQDLKEARDAIDRAIQLHESTIQVIKFDSVLAGVPGTLDAIKQAAEGAKNQFAMGAIPYAMVRVYGIPFETYDSRDECLQRIATAKLNERLQLVEVESVNEAVES